MIEDSSVFQRKDTMLSTPVDQDLVILNPEGSHYVALNHVGRKVWELLKDPSTIGELCAGLAEEFEGDPETMNADVKEFLEEMVREGLVDVLGEATP